MVWSNPRMEILRIPLCEFKSLFTCSIFSNLRNSQTSHHLDQFTPQFVCPIILWWMLLFSYIMDHYHVLCLRDRVYLRARENNNALTFKRSQSAPGKIMSLCSPPSSLFFMYPVQLGFTLWQTKFSHTTSKISRRLHE